MSVASYLRDLFGGDAARVAVALRAVDAEPLTLQVAEAFAKAPGETTTAKASDLLAEQAHPSVGGVLSPSRRDVASTLNPTALASLFRAADDGEIEAFLILAEQMEEREPHYRSVLGTRKLAVSGAQGQVKAASDSAHDKAIAAHAEQVLMRPETEGLVLDLMDAVAKSFACVEIIWDRDGKTWEPTAYRHRDQRHFRFDRDTMRTPMLRTLEAPDGVPLMPFKWLVHMPRLASGVPIRTGIARPVAMCYAAKKYTLADWMAFMDVYGMPLRLGKFPASQADQKAALLRAVRSLGTDACAVIPDGMQIEFIEPKSASSNGMLFQNTAEYFDKQISKVVLGQTMSSDDGASLAQSKTHERVRFDIKKADGRAVDATITRDLIKPFVLLNYGPQAAYPAYVTQTEEPEDRKALIDATKTFVDLGGEVEMSEIRDRMGFAEPAPGAQLLKPAQVVVLEMTPQPKPAPDAPEGDGSSEPPKGGDSVADDDDEIEGDESGARESNASRTNGEPFAAKPRTKDIVDEMVDGELDEWEPLVDGTVVEAMRQIERAESFEAAGAVLDQLKRDAADLDVGPLVSSLAKRQFQAAGLGDAVDDTDV